MPATVNSSKPPMTTAHVSASVMPAATAPACAPAKKEQGAAAATVMAAGKAMETSKNSDMPVPTKTNKRRKMATEDPATTTEGEEKTAEGTWLIVAKAVRMHLKNHEVAMHCGSDALPALNAKVTELINDAITRSQSNGRKTIKASDF